MPKQKFPLNLQLFGDEEQTSNEDETYASQLQNVVTKKDAEIRALKEAHAREVKELTEMVLNGGHKEDEDTEQEVVYTDKEIQALRHDLFHGENDNLSFMRKTLELRKALISKGEIDPFIPIGHKFRPTRDDFEQAEQAAEVFQKLVDEADERGKDSAWFTNELQSIMPDDALSKLRGRYGGMTR